MGGSLLQACCWSILIPGSHMVGSDRSVQTRMCEKSSFLFSELTLILVWHLHPFSDENILI